MAQPEPETLMFEKYLKMRHGIRDHIWEGNFGAVDWAVYSTILLWAGWGTGIWYGNARDVFDIWDSKLNLPDIESSLELLRKKKYLTFRNSSTRYDILVNKYEPTCGDNQGLRLNAFKSLSEPVYETFEAEDGHYTMFRLGIREHIENGRFSATDWAVFSTCLLWSKGGLGVFHGNSSGISSLWSGRLNVRTVQTSMAKLKEARYLTYPNPSGKRGSFPIIIHNYDCTAGDRKGERLNVLVAAR
jgi:hypothetical protein